MTTGSDLEQGRIGFAWIAAPTAWAGVMVLAMLTEACAAASDRQESTAIPDMPGFVHFDTLARPSSPNTWLVAPAAAPPALSADAQAAAFNVPAEQLTAAWMEVIQRQPRTRVVAISDDRLQVEAEQCSALFGFVDKISFRAVPLGTDRATFIAYSRSQAGYWDFGVNRRRLNEWTAALGHAVAEGGGDP